MPDKLSRTQLLKLKVLSTSSGGNIKELKGIANASNKVKLGMYRKYVVQPLKVKKAAKLALEEANAQLIMPSAIVPISYSILPVSQPISEAAVSAHDFAV